MPLAKPLQFTAWSLSRLSDYEKCSFLAKLKHLVKTWQEPGNDAMTRGSDIHKEAEGFGLGRLKKLPESLALFVEEFKELMKHRKTLSVEQQLAVTDKWTATGWFDKNAWLRVVIDALYIVGDRAVAIDYKTGKIRPEHKDQLELYAVVLFIIHTHLEVVDTELWYLDVGGAEGLVKQSFTKAEALKLRPKWEKRVKKMFADRSFKPTPSDHCRWCWFGQSGKQKGGPGVCKY